VPLDVFLSGKDQRLLNRAVLSRRHLLECGRQVVRELDRSRHTTTVPFQYDLAHRDTDDKRQSHGLRSAWRTSLPADNSLYRHGATLKVESTPVLGALRGLSFDVRTGPGPQISSGGTTREVWEANDGKVTFRFTSRDLRSEFLKEATRIFRPGPWELISVDDNDPATPDTWHRPGRKPESCECVTHQLVAREPAIE
jgi:hypothetical protein